MEQIQRRRPAGEDEGEEAASETTLVSHNDLGDLMDPLPHAHEEAEKEKDTAVTVRSESVGPLRFYSLPPLAAASLKSKLAMDSAMSLLLTVITISLYSVVGSSYRRLGLTMSAGAVSAIVFAAISTMAALANALLGVLLYFAIGADRTARLTERLSAPRLAAAKFAVALTTVAASLATCLLASLCEDVGAGTTLLAVTSGAVAAPIYATFLIAEAWALLTRPASDDAEDLCVL